MLFLCTGNSCRSQMAEGFLKAIAGDRIQALSAGVNPAGYVHQKAIQVMQELNIDISEQRSKHINEFLPPASPLPDLIIGVCADADTECPVFPAAVERWQWPFDDPHYAVGDEARKLSEFRRVRDEIRDRILQHFSE